MENKIKKCKKLISVQFSSVQLLSRVRFCNPKKHSTPGLSVHQQLPESTQTHVHQVGDTIQPSHLLSSSSPPAPNPSQHQRLFQWVMLFSWGGQSIGASSSASISLSNGYSGLISFRIDLFHLFAVQITLKSVLQHHISKASILQCSAFFIVQL